MNRSSAVDLSAGIKAKAAGLGFNLCGIAKVRVLREHGPWLKRWTDAGMNDIMGYLARDMDKRLDPEYLLPGARSMIVTGLSYNSVIMQKDPGAPLLSRYTYGNDYHEVITQKLEILFSWVKEMIPDAEGRIVVDSSCLLEKAWATEAGIGCRGKHSVIINREIGSFFFIGILVTTLETFYDKPCEKDLCGTCRKCIDSCPTGAINDDRTIDARKCIANVTIERRGPIPEEIVPSLGRRIYGCDRCQEVCPWNRQAEIKTTPEFSLDEEVAEMSLNDWRSLSQEKFSRLFTRSAMSRVKYEKLMGNIAAAVGLET